MISAHLKGVMCWNKSKEARQLSQKTEDNLISQFFSLINTSLQPQLLKGIVRWVHSSWYHFPVHKHDEACCPPYIPERQTNTNEMKQSSYGRCGIWYKPSDNINEKYPSRATNWQYDICESVACDRLDMHLGIYCDSYHGTHEWIVIYIQGMYKYWIEQTIIVFR